MNIPYVLLVESFAFTCITVRRRRVGKPEDVRARRQRHSRKFHRVIERELGARIHWLRPVRVPAPLTSSAASPQHKRK